MKRGNINNWLNVEDNNNLLFFSQLVNELLFDYSIPSNRVSTLNSHFLCLDALSAITGIDNKGVPEGTLKPIMEELYEEIRKDPAFCEEDSPLDYFVKIYGSGVKPCYRVSEMNYIESKNAAIALYNIFFANNTYYKRLKDRILEIVLNNKEDEQQILFRVTKSLLTELMNQGYSLKYIFMLMNKLFWNTREKVKGIERIKKFLDAFDFQEREYIVIFKVNRENVLPLTKHIDEIECLDSIPANQEKFASNNLKSKKDQEAYIVIKQSALDPFKAAERAEWSIELNASVFRLYNHQYKYDIRNAYAETFDEHRSYWIERGIRAVDHTKMPPARQIAEGMELVNKAIRSIANMGDFDSTCTIINAIRYHAHSLDSLSEENQLLDLWAIFESVLDVSNKHTNDRIQQVCRYLIPILKQNYIYSLFKQLANDIRVYNEHLYNHIIGEAKSEDEIVRRVCEFSILDSKEDDRQKFFNDAHDFPLLKERVYYYKTNLDTPEKIHTFVEKHATRVGWQIRRIYRNRNLIIHNGDSMPYLSLLIENLHSYVDDFLSYTIHCLSNGQSLDSMFQELFVKECRWDTLYRRVKGAITSAQIQELLRL